MVAALAVFASAAAAQLQFDELPRKRHLPPDDDFTEALALGDVDGDGDADMVLGNWGQNRLYLNDGTARFTDATAVLVPAINDNTSAVALEDVDGDGDTDLVFGNLGQNRLYLNDGTGTFTDATAARLPMVNDGTLAVAMGDVDGDGDFDLILGNARQNRLYLNDGTGRFTDVTAARMPTVNDDTYAVALGDVDADGDPDLVFGNTGQNRLYLNDGTGRFTDATGALMPVINDDTSAVALGDVDADGDPDLVFGNARGGSGQQNSLLLNDGSGRFTDATAARMPALNDLTRAVVLADMDADGDPDLVIANGGPFAFSGHENRLYLNDGSGRFIDATAARMPSDTDSTRSVASGDVDGDGDPDLAFGNNVFPGPQRNRLYLNDGTGTFTDATPFRMPTDNDNTMSVARGDLDGDGTPDLVFGNALTNRLYLNDGIGNFTDATSGRMPIDGDHTRAVALADVDGDGDFDLVFGNGGQQNRLYMNDGNGRFADVTSANMPIDSDVTHALALGDIDGDGDPDLVVANGRIPGEQNRLYVNDGTGGFTDATAMRMPIDNDATFATALGDVDGDGDPDLILGNVGQNRLYLNDGTGNFTDATAMRLPIDNDATFATALGDVDRDGDPDLVLGNTGQNRLYLNDGAGRFADATAVGMPTINDSTSALALGDVDGDDDLDLVVANGQVPGEQNRLFLNDGRGVFTDATAARMPTDSGLTSAVALGDLDGDGDPDVVFGTGGHTLQRSNRLYLNLLRQLHTPHLVIAGRQYRLDVYARYGPWRLVDVALPYVSAATARIPLPPFGTLGLDPAFLMPLSPFVIQQPAGVGSVTVTVPNSPGLVGLSIHAQALLLQWPGAAHLTNVTSDQVLR